MKRSSYLLSAAAAITVVAVSSPALTAPAAHLTSGSAIQVPTMTGLVGSVEGLTPLKGSSAKSGTGGEIHIAATGGGGGCGGGCS